MSSYRTLRNHISRSLKQSKASFYHSLSHAPPSKFWSFVKSLRKSSSAIPSLSSNGHIMETNRDKAECLNHFFSSCFNSSAVVSQVSSSTMPPKNKYAAKVTLSR